MIQPFAKAFCGDRKIKKAQWRLDSKVLEVHVFDNTWVAIFFRLLAWGCLFPPKIRPLALSFLWIPWNSSNMLTTCLQYGPTFRMYILFVICLYCVDIFSASLFFKLPTSSSILPRWTIAVLMHRRGEEGRETVPKSGLKMVARCCMSRVHFFFALYLVVFHSFSMFSLAWCRQPKVLAVLTTVLVKVFASSDKLCLAFARPWLDRTRIRWTRTRQKKCLRHLHPPRFDGSMVELRRYVELKLR